MIRDISTKELWNYKTGGRGGYAVQLGCMNFHFDTEEEARRAVIAYVNDPALTEEAFWMRQDRKQNERPAPEPIEQVNEAIPNGQSMGGTM